MGRFAWKQYKKSEEEKAKPLFVPYRVLKPQPACLFAPPQQMVKDETKRVCAVLGATEFIGSYVVNELVRRKEYHVIAIGPTFQENRTNPDVDGIIQVDALDFDGLVKAFKGVDSVINAAVIHPYIGCTPMEIYSKNRLVVANILLAAKQTGVKNYIHISGIPTKMDNGIADPISKAYKKSLFGNEKMVLDANDNGLRTCSIAPPCVFGLQSDLLSDLMETKSFVDIDNMPISFVSVEYACLALVNAEKKLADPNTTHEIAGKAFRFQGELMSWKKFLSLPAWPMKIQLTSHFVMSAMIKINMICYKFFSWAPFGSHLVTGLLDILGVVEILSEEESQKAYKVLEIGPPNPPMNEYIKQIFEEFKAKKKRL